MKANDTRIHEVQAILTVVLARLDSHPRDYEDWSVIREQLRAAVIIAQIARKQIEPDGGD